MKNVKVKLPTKEQFRKYVRVQKSGVYNMIVEARSAMFVSDLNKETYMAIIDNYKKLMEKYPDVIKEFDK